MVIPSNLAAWTSSLFDIFPSLFTSMDEKAFLNSANYQKFHYLKLHNYDVILSYDKIKLVNPTTWLRYVNTLQQDARAVVKTSFQFKLPICMLLLGLKTPILVHKDHSYIPCYTCVSFECLWMSVYLTVIKWTKLLLNALLASIYNKPPKSVRNYIMYVLNLLSSTNTLLFVTLFHFT